MRIQLTSVEESKKAEQIEHIIKSIFPKYTVTVIPNKYATEKGKQKCKHIIRNITRKIGKKYLKKKEKEIREKEKIKK